VNTSGASCSTFSQVQSNINVAFVSISTTISAPNILPKFDKIFTLDLMNNICRNFLYRCYHFDNKINNARTNRSFFENLAESDIKIKSDLVLVQSRLHKDNILRYINNNVRLNEPLSVAEYWTYVSWAKLLRLSSSEYYPNLKRRFSEQVGNFRDSHLLILVMRNVHHCIRIR